jgi:hypothetical protein
VDTTGLAEAGVPARQGERGVLCIKCEHLNPQGIESCEFCGSPLFVNCKDCGAKNARVNPRCTSCGRRMHKRRKRNPSPRSGVNRWLVGVVLALILVVMVLLMGLAGVRLF